MKSKKLVVALFSKLKACESSAEPITPEQTDQIWMRVVRLNEGETFTRCRVAALLVYDTAFQEMIPGEDWKQFMAIVKKAADQYERQLNPHTDVGYKLADALNPKEEEE